MSELTPNLKLFKYDTLIDGKEVFSINRAMNDNWDKIDSGTVRKTGDTMSGDLNIARNSSSTLNLISTNIDYLDLQPPESNIVPNRVLFSDKNNQWFGYCQTMYSPQNRLSTGIAARRMVNGVQKVSSVNAHVDEQGSVWGTAPASDKSSSIVVTSAITKALNGYVRFGNGIILQWGRVEHVLKNNAYAATVTFSTAFSNTNYAFTICDWHDPALGVGEWLNTNGAHSLKTTGFTMAAQHFTTGVSWIAIGY